MKERGTRPTIEALWQLSKAVRLEVNDPDKNLETAKNHLKTGSILLYANHFSTLDTTVLARFLDENLSLNDLSILAGRKHFDPQRGISSRIKNSVIQGFAETKGFEILQVVQNYELDLYQDSRQFNLNSLKKAVKALNAKGQILAISPEGTRSRTGGLLKAEDGIDILFKLGRNKALALPIAMHPYKIVPPFTKTAIEVGFPFSYQEIEIEKESYPELSITDLMMRRLAILLPQENRGYYNKT